MRVPATSRQSGVIFAVVLSILIISGCGGGGGGTSAPAPDFAISASPASVSLLGGGSAQTCTVSVTGSNGFSGIVSVTLQSVPNGVSATPSSFNLTAGSEQLVTLSATSSAVETTSTITFNGASGSLSHSTQLSVSVLYPVTGMHSPLRTRYIRTNSYYDPNVLQAAPPHFTVYDPARKQFFVSNPYMNVIDVFDAKLEVEITTIPVPLAWGIDISPITGNLYAGTLEGDVYEFNTGTYALI